MESVNARVAALMEKGVTILNPASVTIGEEVDLNRISGDGVVIHPGCRIHGRKTLIMKGGQLGEEAPATVRDCQLGPHVKLKGGFCTEAVFLAGSSLGYGAHVRKGTILEEEAGAAHTVGLKQTILLPFVTLGSLINFCDCLMSGGTSRKDHSEVGSSYIHFNYTPNQDKATPSLLGDVPRGVMLDRRPIFLGGQGGLVGPCRLAFGTVTAAGTINRKDELREGRLIVSGAMRGGSFPFKAGSYGNIRRLVTHNLFYIANLTALMAWYRFVRGAFVSDAFPAELHQGLIEKLTVALDERIHRLGGLAGKIRGSLPGTASIAGAPAGGKLDPQQAELVGQWDALEVRLRDLVTYAGDRQDRDLFLEKLSSAKLAIKGPYLKVIKGLDENAAKTGTFWLQGVVDHVMDQCFELLPSFGGQS